MAEAKPREADEAPEQGEGADASTGKKFNRRRLAFFGMIAGLMLTEAIVIVLFSGGSTRGGSISAGEVEVGDFVFARTEAPRDEINRVQFRLHVRLFPDHVAEALPKLTANRFQFREGVEEILRQAVAADFEDPLLVDLKRRIQERLNQDLEQRAVAKCIVTHLEIERSVTTGGNAPSDVARSEQPLKSPESLVNLPESAR